MEIKTITCHDVYNYGASLQAFALQKYLVDQGHSVEIIDYKPDYLSGHYDLWKVNHHKWNRNFFTRIAYLSIKLPFRLMDLRRKGSFDVFRKKYLKLTSKRYTTNEELKEDCPKADIFIAGSDQIWNTIFPNGRDAAFYLDFATKESKKIAYAASFATESVVPEYKEFVKKMLQNFNNIAVRERGAVDILKTLGVYDGTWVCDPVFLLERQEWDKIAVKEYKEEYILVYDFEGNERIKKIALKLAGEYNLKVFTINVRLDYSGKSFKNIDPADFVSLIRDAKYIISNSFHGTVFSLIYKKEFFVVSREEGINTRMQNLLEYLNLSDRMDPIVENVSKLNPINYTEVDQVLQSFIADSKLFLKSNLG